MRAASITVASIERTPATVLTTMGKNAAYATMITAAPVPAPNHRMAIGTRAIAAIGRTVSIRWIEDLAHQPPAAPQHSEEARGCRAAHETAGHASNADDEGAEQLACADDLDERSEYVCRSRQFGGDVTCRRRVPQRHEYERENRVLDLPAYDRDARLDAAFDLGTSSPE